VRKTFISLDFELSGSHLKQVDIHLVTEVEEEKGPGQVPKFNGQKFAARGYRG